MKVHTFHIEHNDWSVVLQLPSEGTLEDLAYAIIDAVGFDMDHCYGFYKSLDRNHRDCEQYSLFADIGEEAESHDRGVETTAIDTVFTPKKQMIFLFDYGDSWRFLVTCVKEEIAHAFKRPKRIGESGTPPVQYTYYPE